ncbi:MAG: hypothetical protein ABL950_03050 [Nitrospira sp.]
MRYEGVHHDGPLLLMFWAGLVVFGHPAWFHHPGLRGYLLMVGTGMVTIMKWWSYIARMPLFPGIAVGNRVPIHLLTAFVLPLFISCGVGTQYEHADCGTLSGKDAMRCVEYRQRKANAEISREAAELLKGYRQCIQKHEGDVTKTKESCALYREGLERIEVSSMSCSCM